MVNRRIVDPRTGETIRLIQDADEFGFAVPVSGKTGWFRVEEASTGNWFQVDAQTGSVYRSTEPRVQFHEKRLVLLDNLGKQLWTADLPEQGDATRPSDVLVTRDMVIVAYNGNASAYGIDSGNHLWTSAWGNKRLCLWNDLIIATLYTQHRQDSRTLLARRVSDGSQAWKLDLPQMDDPGPPLIVGPWVVIRNSPYFYRDQGKECLSVLVDSKGHEHHRFNEYIHDILPYKGDFLFVTNLRVARIDPTGTVIWQSKHQCDLKEPGSLVGTIHRNALYLHNWFGLADSGVDLRLIDIDKGIVVWDVHCPRLNVGHSKYRHEAYLQIQGESLIVVSQGSYGWFLEELQARDGRRRRRWASAMPGAFITPQGH